jgi:CDP-diacylglycerol--glycerol-3-phosphate 3-phosphatidyltransferase
MLNILARASVSRVTDPIGAWILRRGVSPNAMTLLGTFGSAGGALWFFPRGELLAGTLVVTVFLFFDLLDGAMARTAGRSTPFGAVLDASCDRIVDGVLFGSITWWALVVAGHPPTGLAALVCLVCAQVISYIKARAEASGLRADGGLVERAERFIVVLVGAGLSGFGIPFALDVALWVLAALSVLTVVQRFAAVLRSARAEPGETRGDTDVEGE